MVAVYFQGWLEVGARSPNSPAEGEGERPYAGALRRVYTHGRAADMAKGAWTLWNKVC